jgi:glycosyltransferase involved in cell wall biosynthesis
MQEEQVDISIIIPTFNRLWCLPAALESCRGTRCKTEIIVIDDGSTDGTWNWLSTQKNLIAVNQANAGKCSAVNKGYSLAKGKYIKFLDSDDLIVNNTLDAQLGIAEKENADIVVSGYQLMDDEGGIFKKVDWPVCDDFIAQQLGECDSSHYSAYLFRKGILSDIPHREEYCFRDDRLLVLEVALKKPRVSVQKGQTLIHRTHSGSRLQFRKGAEHRIQNKQHYKIYQKILGLLKARNELTERRINASTQILWALSHWTAKYNLKEATEMVKWIYSLNPAFDPPEHGILKKIYRVLGFRNTERLLRLRRLLLKNG